MKIQALTSVSSQELTRVGNRVYRRLNQVREPVNKAMAEQFKQCTFDNLGAAGTFRPHTWAALSPGYAKKVKRSYATLFVSGVLKAAIKSRSNEEFGRVSVNKGDCEYALAHQFGVPEKNLPARPFIPVHENGKIVVAVKILVIKAAKLALRIAFR